MKKIILSLVTFLAFSTTYAQDPTLTFSSVTITPSGGTSETFNTQNDFLEAIAAPELGENFRELDGGTEYLFTFDYANQPATVTSTGATNTIIVKTLEVNWGDVQAASSVAISGAGSATVSFIPNLDTVASSDRLQFRTAATIFPKPTDNTFIYDVKATQGSLSAKSISKAKLEVSYNIASATVTLPISTGYSVYAITGNEILKGEGSQVSLAGLTNGIYFIATEKGTAKVLKQ